MISREADGLAAALEAGDIGDVLAHLAACNEITRRRLASIVMTRIRELKDEFELVETGLHSATMRRRRPRAGDPEASATVAAFGTCTAAELQRLARAPGFRRFTEAEPIIAALRPRPETMLVEIVAWLCRPSVARWDVAQALVREKRCPRPEHDDWILGLYDRERHGRVSRRQVSLLELLRDDPMLLADIWRMFEVEGAPERSLSTFDATWSKDGWHAALLALAAEGRLPRERLLDASLEALGRDFTPYHAAWYSRFHEALEPSPGERRARLNSYIRLVTSQVPATAALAVQVIDSLAATDAATDARIVSALGTALPTLLKAPALTALRVLRRAAEHDAGLAAPVARAATAALLSKSADVQAEGIALLGRHGDPSDVQLRSDVAAALPLIAPRLRARVAPWLDAAETSAGDAATASAVVHGDAASRCDADEPLPPAIASLDELVLAASALIEEASDPMAIERVMDGISRLCGERPPDFERRTSALRRRCRSTLGARGAEGKVLALKRRLCLLMLGWLEQDPDPAAGFPLRFPPVVGNAGAFLLARLDALTRQASSGRGLPLLSLPAWRSGLAAPADVVARWLAWQEAGSEPDIHEQVAALLRLHPAGRPGALTLAAGVRGGGGEALRFALGDARSPVAATAPAWLAAARARDPRGDFLDLDRAHPGLGPDGGRAAVLAWRAFHRESHPYRFFTIETDVEPALPAAIPTPLVTVLFHQAWFPAASYAYGQRPDDAWLVRWAATVWPAHHESALARAAVHVAGADSAADRELRPYVELLAARHVELGPMARLVLALALASGMTELRVPAQDALIAAIEQGRLDAPALGETMARLLESGENTLCRWARSLRVAAEASPVHARMVQTTLEVALTRPPREMPPQAGTLIELLADLVAMTGEPVTSEACRAVLATMAGSGRAARCARRLLG